MELEFHEIFFIKLEIKNDTANLKAIFFKEFEFLELKLYGKLEFHKFEFKKGGRLFNNSQTMAYH